ncbi:MAG: hypothetical protein CFE23_04450 [Flavobacterium sp. BFFFF1]|uniref:GldM family protein n=1 Tax=Flavobacterium sp. BFFFF1 TaxID=2015557 RepID=UPI000BC436ED|nr:GldM family protein [Flavobacterium sp. BFFFF1]OYU81351.1 MAG: hypothetical protein CFE23_04450 [Flavobacterium sp. BFFFF1]
MKKWHFILLFIFSCSYAQHDSISKPTGVVAADRMNVVYRGVANPISISVPDCKSFTAEAPGLTKVSEGHYTLSPGVGLESVIILHIKLKNDSERIEEHRFRIKNIGYFSGLIDGKNCVGCIVEMTKEDLKQAIISLAVENFAFDIDPPAFHVYGFDFNYQDKIIRTNQGNKFNAETLKIINKLKIGSIFKISRIIRGGNGCYPPIEPIKIMIVEPEIAYYESQQFVKDSLDKIKKDKKLLERSRKRK